MFVQTPKMFSILNILMNYTGLQPRYLPNYLNMNGDLLTLKYVSNEYCKFCCKNNFDYVLLIN